MFAGLQKIPTFATANAEIAQLVEHNLAKVGVASSSLVFRSIEMIATNQCPGGGIGRRARFRCVCREACRFESCSGHTDFKLGNCGNSSVGRAQPCQGWGREFESRFPLIERGLIFIGPLFCFLKVDVCRSEVDVCSAKTEDGLT